MKAAVVGLILLFTFSCCGIRAQNCSGIFKYTDKAGNPVSIDLSILPSFLDTTFLKNTTFFEDTTKTNKYSIVEFSCSKKYNTKMDKREISIRIYKSWSEKDSSDELNNTIAMMEIMHETILLKRKLKNEWIVEKILYVGFEI